MKPIELRIRNFQIIGKQILKFNFKEGITIFSGVNGSGKTTIISALQFVWYGKTLDGKNKSDLVNWINKNDCLVEFDFEVKNDLYTIGRTIKPDSNYIIKNGEKLDDSGTKKFNEHVERLLNIDKKIGEQTIFLSKDFYQPFLRLKSIEKRDFLKRIFDFEIYEKMEEKFKEEFKKLSNEILKVENEKNKLEILIETLNNRLKEDIININDLKIVKNKTKNEIQYKLEQLCFSEKSNEGQEELLQTYFIKINDLDRKETILKTKMEINENKKEKYNEYTKEIETRKSKITKHIDITADEIKHAINGTNIFIENNNNKIEYYQNNEKCSECHKIITKEEKEENIKQLKDQNEKLEKKKDDLIIMYDNKINEEQMLFFETKLNELDYRVLNYNNEIEIISKERIDVKKIYDEVKRHIDNYNRDLLVFKQLNMELDMINKSFNEIEQQEIKINNSKENIKNMKNDIDKLQEKIYNLNKKELLIKKLILMVQDNGIKKYIISNYIPILNKIAMKYIDRLNSKFMIQFDKNGLDVEVTHRGNKTRYNSLSGGEKQRVDLAMLFTWLEFSRLKNNTVFPMIFLDEVLDSSLDREGITDLIKILKDIKENIPYVNIITHNEANSTIADRIIKVKKEGRWSKYEEE